METTWKTVLLTEAIVYTAELQAIKLALSMVETSTKQKWTYFIDSQVSIQALLNKILNTH